MTLNGLNRIAVALLTAAMVSGLSIGCAKKTEKTEKTKTGDAKTTPAGLAGLPEKHQEALKKLPEADLKLALAQKICPMSGEPLGSMGVPIKVEAKGHTLFVCCSGCEGPVKKDPEKFLAKLKEKKTAE